MGFDLKDNLWKFRFLFSLPVTTRSDSQLAQPRSHTPIKMFHQRIFMTLSFTVSEEMEINFWISQLHISSLGVTSPKTFDVTVHISSVYNMYLFQVKHISNKKDLRHWKFRIWNLFFNNRKSTSGMVNNSEYLKTDLIMWYKFWIEKINYEIFNFLHFRWRLEVMTKICLTPYGQPQLRDLS